MAIRGMFGQFNAGYQEEVKLYRSSSANGGVWLRITQQDVDPEKKDFEGNPVFKLGEASAHLTPNQAVVLRAMLDSYLAEHNEEE
jgi:hypothetical protein